MAEPHLAQHMAEPCGGDTSPASHLVAAAVTFPHDNTAVPDTATVVVLPLGGARGPA